MSIRKIFLTLAMISMAFPHPPQVQYVQPPPSQLINRFVHLERAITDRAYMDTLSIDQKTGIVWVEKRLPDGRGIRLNRDFTFKGFVD